VTYLRFRKKNGSSVIESYIADQAPISTEITIILNLLGTYEWKNIPKTKEDLMNPKRDKKEREAEKYAKVKYKGIGPLGQPIYSASNPWLLSQRERKMDAFKAGYDAANKRLSKFEKILKKDWKSLERVLDFADSMRMRYKRVEDQIYSAVEIKKVRDTLRTLKNIQDKTTKKEKKS
jgi:hypothetical protein